MSPRVASVQPVSLAVSPFSRLMPWGGSYHVLGRWYLLVHWSAVSGHCVEDILCTDAAALNS